MRLSPLQMPVPNSKLPRTSKQLGYKLEVPTFLYSNLNNLLQWITELRNTFTSLLKNYMIMDTDEEAVSLVKYQNAYNLASRMMQCFTEIYDRLILQTGV